MENSHPSHRTVRRTVFFTGRVQGVGFRYMTEAIARQFAVSGFVRNLPDGRVELVAEGEPAELDRFVASVVDTMETNISQHSSVEQPATGDFDGFAIAFR